MASNYSIGKPGTIVGQQSPSKQTFGLVAPWAEPASVNDLESPYYDDTHRRLRNYVRTYVDQHIIPHQLDWERIGGAPREAAWKYVASGIPNVDIPKQYRPKDFHTVAEIDTDELDAFHMLVMTDETSRVEGGVMVSLSGANVIGVPPRKRLTIIRNVAQARCPNDRSRQSWHACSKSSFPAWPFRPYCVVLPRHHRAYRRL